MEHLGIIGMVVMVTVGLLVIGGLQFSKKDAMPTCPCSDVRFCARIRGDPTRKEVFVFSLNPKNDDWQFYDWTKVTTVVMVGYVDMKLMCLAHKHGARVVYIGLAITDADLMPRNPSQSYPAGVSTETLTNPVARAAWTQRQLQFIKDHYLDGVNFDYESAILQNQTSVRQGYTALVAETKKALTDFFPYLSVTVDVAWSPDCIDLRCYDFVGLAKAADFLFVMAYDEQSQIYGECIASANSGYPRTMSGLNRYLALGVSPDKLVLGVPWYGYNYQCLSLSQDNVCTIKPVPFRGVNCSDAAGRQNDYFYTLRLIKNSTTGRRVDPTTLSPFFNYKEADTGVIHQVWYDDPTSLGLKYEMAVDMNLRGVGMWNAESVKYNSQDPEDIAAVKAMWDAFPNYKQNTNMIT